MRTMIWSGQSIFSANFSNYRKSDNFELCDDLLQCWMDFLKIITAIAFIDGL